MRLFLMHLAPGPAATSPDEHADIVVPGGDKVVVQVPVTALERFLPHLADATREVEQRCPRCGENLATWPPDHARGR